MLNKKLVIFRTCSVTIPSSSHCILWFIKQTNIVGWFPRFINISYLSCHHPPVRTSDITVRILIISITKIRGGRVGRGGEGRGGIIFVVLLNHTHCITQLGESSGRNYDNSGVLTEDLLHLLFLGEPESWFTIFT